MVSTDKPKTYDDLYNRLDTKECKKTIYKLAKRRKKQKVLTILNVLKVKMKES